MTATFPLHDEMTAPEAARDALADTKRNFGMIPNLERVMAKQALEVVLGLAVKTMSNFTNSIAGTPLDREVKNLAWRKPRVAMRRQDEVR